MRKVILLAVLIASLTGVKAQFNLNVPVGYSSEKAPVIGVNIQYNISHFIIAAGFDSNVSRDATKGDLFWTRIGASLTLNELNTIEVTAGAGQYYRSGENKALNEGLAVFSTYYVHQMASRPEGAIIAGITATNRFYFVSAGLRFIFRRGERDGCPSTWVR